MYCSRSHCSVIWCFIAELVRLMVTMFTCIWIVDHEYTCLYALNFCIGGNKMFKYMSVYLRQQLIQWYKPVGDMDLWRPRGNSLKLPPRIYVTHWHWQWNYHTSVALLIWSKWSSCSPWNAKGHLRNSRRSEEILGGRPGRVVVDFALNLVSWFSGK